jgi:molybdopterin converting factor small subunit
MNTDNKKLQKANEYLANLLERLHNKRIGFEPKCKVCTSKLVNEVEQKRREGASLEELKKYMMDTADEDVSIMSLSRHFNTHYQQKLQYADEKRLEEEKLLEKGETEVQQLIEYYPELKQLMNGEQTIYESVYENGQLVDLKTREKTGREIFILEYGFCTTGLRLCKLVPKLQILCNYEVMEKIRLELEKIDSYSYLSRYDKERVKILENHVKCSNCQHQKNEFTLDCLIQLVLNNLLGVDVDPEKFKWIINEDIEYDYRDLFNELMKYKKTK